MKHRPVPRPALICVRHFVTNERSTKYQDVFVRGIFMQLPTIIHQLQFVQLLYRSFGSGSTCLAMFLEIVRTGILKVSLSSETIVWY